MKRFIMLGLLFILGECLGLFIGISSLSPITTILFILSLGVTVYGIAKFLKDNSKSKVLIGGVLALMSAVYLLGMFSASLDNTLRETIVKSVGTKVVKTKLEAIANDFVYYSNSQDNYTVSLLDNPSGVGAKVPESIKSSIGPGTPVEVTVTGYKIGYYSMVESISVNKVLEETSTPTPLADIPDRVDLEDEEGKTEVEVSVVSPTSTPLALGEEPATDDVFVITPTPIEGANYGIVPSAVSSGMVDFVDVE